MTTPFIDNIQKQIDELKKLRDEIRQKHIDAKFKAMLDELGDRIDKETIRAIKEVMADEQK